MTNLAIGRRGYRPAALISMDGNSVNREDEQMARPSKEYQAFRNLTDRLGKSKRILLHSPRLKWL